MKKNPFMSMWLSAANKAAGTARATAAGAAKREVAHAQADATKQVLEFWGVKPTNTTARKKSRR